MARTRKKKAGNIFSSKDKDNKHMYPMVFLCVALSRCCYDNPVKFLNNVSILFNMNPFRKLLKNSQSQDDFLLRHRGFKDLDFNPQKEDGEIQLKYSGKLPYKLLAAYINKGADIISKKGITEKQSMKRGVNELSARMDVLPPEFYKNKTVFADKSIRGQTQSKIRSIFVCTINDLNCYVLHHMDFNFIFVIFRGTLSVKSTIKDARVLRKNVDTTGKEAFDEGSVHLGFLENLDQAFSRICYCIANIQKQHSKSCKIISTGHSLGGALSTIFTYFYARYYDLIKELCTSVANIAPKRKIHTVAVSAPRQGGEKWAGKFDTLLKDGNSIEYVNMFNRRDLIPKVPKAGVGSMSKWRRVGRTKGKKKEIVLCGNSSSMIPPFTGTNYKGNLKCTYGKGTTFADVFLGTFASNHLFIYFINFMSNARSPFQTRPEKAFLRFIIWNGSEWKSLFIDNWRCNHVMDAENYKNEMEQTVKYKSLVLYKKRTDAESVEAKVAPGKGTKNSVRFRNYSRDCKTRESQGPNMPNAADEARKLAEQAPQAAGKRKRRRRRSTKKKRRKGKKKKTRKRR